MATNRFNEIVEKVESCPKNQRADTLISGLAQFLQQSQNQTITPAQMGQELQQVRPQIVQALQQGG